MFCMRYKHVFFQLLFVHLGPHQRVWIIFICMFMLACLLLYFMLVITFLILGFATLDALSEFGGCVVTSNIHEALFGCNHLGCITMMPVALCILFPFFLIHVMLCLPCLFVPPVGFLSIFTRLLICPCMSLAC